MIERYEDKPHDYGMAISEVERLSWNNLLDTFHILSFQHNREIWFSWDNQQLGLDRRLARLDRIYTPRNRGNDFIPYSYSIHGNSLGFDHAPVKLNLNIGQGERRPSLLNGMRLT